MHACRMNPITERSDRTLTLLCPLPRNGRGGIFRERERERKGPSLLTFTHKASKYHQSIMEADAVSHRSRATGVSRKSSVTSRQSQLIKKNTGAFRWTGDGTWLTEGWNRSNGSEAI